MEQALDKWEMRLQCRASATMFKVMQIAAHVVAQIQITELLDSFQSIEKMHP